MMIYRLRDTPQSMQWGRRRKEGVEENEEPEDFLLIPLLTAF